MEDPAPIRNDVVASARKRRMEQRMNERIGESSRSVSEEPPVHHIVSTCTPSANGHQRYSHHNPRNPGVQSFQPSAGPEAAQPLPAHLDELDFSWLLDLPNVDAPAPEYDQEQYLWLYFTHRPFSGLEMNIARFYERLASPDELERPHPALLNAIYMTVTRASPIPSVRARAETFYNKAEAAFSAAVRDNGTLRLRMLDLMRAAVLMAEWLFTELREGEAVLLTASVCRIAISCCFDQIPSSTLVEPAHNVRMLLRRKPLCPLPVDQVDLADRIYAFWSVAMLDMSASIATCVPPHIDPTRILTPLPKPWASYTDDSNLPDCYLADMFKFPDEQLAPQTPYGYMIQTTVLLQLTSLKSVALFHKSPPGWIFSAMNGVCSVPDRELGAALDRFDKTLPVDFKSQKLSADGTLDIDSSAFTIRFFLAAARMYYADTNSYEEPNDAALYQARHIVDLIRLCSTTSMQSMSLLVYMMWILAADMLIREVKRLEVQGESLAAITLNRDIDFLIQTLTFVCQDSPLFAAELDGLYECRAWQPQIRPSTATTNTTNTSSSLNPSPRTVVSVPSTSSGSGGRAEPQAVDSV
nr:uncharacterized protein CI109_006734 [Kwoniella shandongensis]KAA5524934.1 hypothetical protein CI109_006734 [Kwoniella shandongensis]